MFAEAEVLMILLPLIFEAIACGSVHHTVRLATIRLHRLSILQASICFSSSTKVRHRERI